MPQDSQLKALLLKAIAINNQKTSAITSTESQEKTTILNLQKEFSAIAQRIKKIVFFARLKGIDEAKLQQHITKIENHNLVPLGDYATTCNKCLFYVKEHIPLIILQTDAPNMPSNWNFQTIGALSDMHKAFSLKEEALTDQGTDPFDDADYEAADEKFGPLKQEYKELLRTNVIQATATDRNILNHFTEEVIKIATVAAFIPLREHINTYIEGEIPVA